MKTISNPCLLLVLALAGVLRLEARPPTISYRGFYSYPLPSQNAIPSSGLIVGPGWKFYGVTYGNDGAGGTGTIYQFAPTGPCTYAFNPFYRCNSAGSPGLDGMYPNAGLTLSSDSKILYGTTFQGGNGGGVFFGFNIAQGESNPNTGQGYEIKSMFDPKNLGSGPQGTLADDIPNFLFGTLTSGGPNGGGAVYRINKNDWSVTGLHYFGLNDPWGNNAQGRLAIGQVGFSSLLSFPGGPVKPRDLTNIDLSMITLYGITRKGGSNSWGTAYRVDGNGSNFMVLHHFNFSTSDGSIPRGGMVLSGNTLYGTTSGGGASYAGTVFRINTDGTGFQIIGNFDYSTTGSQPQGDLIISGDTLYGTTYAGGTNGGGTVFSINTSGSNFVVLHSFTTPKADGSGGYTNSDGGWSVSGLLLYDNILLGTTPYGGTNEVGVAYAIVLPSPPSLRITPSGSNLELSWPSWASNYTLLQNSSLSTTSWTTNHLAVSDNGTNRTVTLVPAAPNTFFRLLSTQGL
jgi:uncharacterized repeat protein (TIGR03803 family)